MKTKKHISVIAAIIFCLVMVACSGKQSPGQQHDQAKQAPAKATPQQAQSDPQPVATIYIYRYDDFSEAKAARLRDQLKQVYPSVILAETSIPLPKECYYKIIYIKNEISPTFGVFGISYVGGSVSVISSLRPRTLKPLSDNDMQELMLHELGHAFGLPHCKDERCMMVDAEHGCKFAQTQSFCSSCKNYLNSKGWKL